MRAAVWSAIQVALGATLVSPAAQSSVLHALRTQLLKPWQKESTSSASQADWFDERAAHYILGLDARNPTASAVRIVETLLEATSIPLPDRTNQIRLLAGLISHRIISDTWLFNEWHAQGKFLSAPQLL